MSRVTVRAIAALLATVMTASALMGIAALAQVEFQAGQAVVVLPAVEVTAGGPEPRPGTLAGAVPTGG